MNRLRASTSQSVTKDEKTSTIKYGTGDNVGDFDGNGDVKIQIGL